MFLEIFHKYINLLFQHADDDIHESKIRDRDRDWDRDRGKEKGRDWDRSDDTRYDRDDR